MNPPTSHLLRRNLAIAAIALASSLSSRTHAALIIEPVFNRVEGSGQADDNFPLYDPGYLIGGVAYFDADEPGEIITYAAGDPRDPFLDEFHVWNNTGYVIAGFTLRLVGTATVTDDPGTVSRGPVDAVWGDVDLDGLVGSSDVFSSITVSADGKEIRFEGGLIPVGGRFTDVHLAFSDAPPDLAGIDSSFSGVRAVPEPSGWVLLGAGVTASAVGGKGRSNRRAAARRLGHDSERRGRWIGPIAGEPDPRLGRRRRGLSSIRRGPPVRPIMGIPTNCKLERGRRPQGGRPFQEMGGWAPR